MINPQWAVLDSTIHTVEYVSARSALLTTTILAVGATALSQRPDGPEWRVTEALRLHAHTQNLKLVVFAAGARSIEIVQAQIVRTQLPFSFVFQVANIAPKDFIPVEYFSQFAARRTAMDACCHGAQNGC